MLKQVIHICLNRFFINIFIAIEENKRVPYIDYSNIIQYFVYIDNEQKYRC